MMPGCLPQPPHRREGRAGGGAGTARSPGSSHPSTTLLRVFSCDCEGRSANQTRTQTRHPSPAASPRCGSRALRGHAASRSSASGARGRRQRSEGGSQYQHSRGGAILGNDLDSKKIQTFFFAIRGSYFVPSCNNFSHPGYDSTQQTLAPTQWMSTDPRNRTLPGNTTGCYCSLHFNSWSWSSSALEFNLFECIYQSIKYSVIQLSANSLWR